MSDIASIMDALAAQIEARLSPNITDLQVDGRFIPNPTPPAIDVYPAPEFQVPLAMGKGNNYFLFEVRARVGPIDNEGMQNTLLSMMDPAAATSVAQAIMYDRDLGGTVAKVNISEGPSGFGLFLDTLGNARWMGCTWTVQVVP